MVAGEPQAVIFGGIPMKFKTKQFEIKSVSDTGEVTGYFSTYDVKADAYGDIIAPHAFDETIKARREIGKPFPLVWNHNMDDPELIIGQVDNIEDDENGPLMTAHFYDTPKAQAARNLVKEGSVYQFSFAYGIDAARKPNDDEKSADPNIRQVLEKLSLLEVTITPTPANPYAVVTDVKAGRRNSSKDADAIRQAITLLQGVLGELEDTDEEPRDSEAKSEEQDPANDEEQKKLEALLKEANDLINS